MVRTYDIGFYDLRNCDGVAERVVEELQSAGLDPKNHFYRGFSCDDNIWASVLATGSDRTLKDAPKHARALITENPGFKLSIKSALEEKDPRFTYLSALSSLPFSADLALTGPISDNVPFGAISVYDHNGVKRISPIDSEQDRYEFIVDPLKSLKALFKLRPFRR